MGKLNVGSLVLGTALGVLLASAIVFLFLFSPKDAAQALSAPPAIEGSVISPAPATPVPSAAQATSNEASRDQPLIQTQKPRRNLAHPERYTPEEGIPIIQPPLNGCWPTQEENQRWSAFVTMVREALATELGPDWGNYKATANAGGRLLQGDPCRGPFYEITTMQEARAAVRWSMYSGVPPTPTPAAWTRNGQDPPINPAYGRTAAEVRLLWARLQPNPSCFATDEQAKRWQAYRDLLIEAHKIKWPGWNGNPFHPTDWTIWGGDACRGPLWLVATVDEALAVLRWYYDPRPTPTAPRP